MERNRDETLASDEYKYTFETVKMKLQDEIDIDIISKISNLSVAEINNLLK